MTGCLVSVRPRLLSIRKVVITELGRDSSEMTHDMNFIGIFFEYYGQTFIE